MSTGTDPPGAAARMGVLVDKILAAVPESMVLVSGLMPMSNQAAEKLSVSDANFEMLRGFVLLFDRNQKWRLTLNLCTRWKHITLDFAKW